MNKMFQFGLAVLLALGGVSPATRGYAATTTIPVTPASTDWLFVNDNGGTDWTAGFESGPGVLPLGTGSVYIELSSAGAGIVFGTQKYQGTLLSSITTLSYSTYTNLSPAVMAFQVNYDPDVTTIEASTWYGRLIYEPYMNGTVTNGTWQTWDMINGGNGKWWASISPNSTVDEACPQSIPCTWTALITAFPNIGIRNDDWSFIQFKAGSNWNGFAGNVDNLNIEIGGNTDTYDFEPLNNVYVDDSWSVVTPGTDPDGDGPALLYGTDSFDTIQEGINAVAINGTVHVADGTYTEAGQIVINKGLSIVGAGMSSTIIKPDSDTGNSDDDSGWFLVNSGMVFNLSNVTLDGAGHKISQAIRHHGSGIIDHVRFINIKYEESGPAYEGTGVEVITNGNIDVTNSEFSEMGRYGVQVWDGGGTATGTYSGNTYTGKGAGNWLDYAFEIGWGAHITIENNVVTNNQGVATSDGSGSSAISVWDDPDTQATINANTLTNNTVGVAIAVINGGGSDPTVTIGAGNVISGGTTGIDVESVGAFGSPTLTITGTTISNNVDGISVVSGMTADNLKVNNSLLSGNSNSAVTNNGTGIVDAENNWWGAVSGPGVVGSGTGDKISANVDFSPWCTNAACTTFAPPFATATIITVDTPDPSLPGQPVWVTATVTGLPTGAPTPTGTVTISGGVADCTINIASATGSCEITFNTNGAKTITATYNPDAAGFSSSSDTESHTVNEIATFSDVATDYWAWMFIERLYAAGVTAGCGNGNYCPETIVTRDQMAVLLLKGKHISSYVPPTATGVFADVPTDYWAADWIEQLAVEGITAGCSVSPQQYCPTTPVTRDQMAVFLLKAVHGSGYVPPTATGVFADVPTGYWAADWIEQLAAEGITSGCSVSPKLYCPMTPVTRDQMAVFLVKNFNLP